MDKVILDGKWSFSGEITTEWKFSSENLLKYDDGAVIVLRSAHQGDFIYFLIDFVSDRTIDWGMDKATICFDTKNNKSKTPDPDDYCFISSLSTKSSHSYQGGSQIATQSHLKKIPNHPDFVAVGGESGKYDRYSQLPHTAYEFKIPTDVIGRESVYGFYFEVFDYSSKNTYSWPNDIKTQTKLTIKSPTEWGEMVSPDKSLPEFGVPFLVLTTFFVSLIAISKTRACFHIGT